MSERHSSMSTVDCVSTVLVWHVFAVVMRETTGQGSRSTNVADYMDRAIERLGGGEDSGLYPAGMVDVWSKLSRAQREDVSRMSREGAARLAEFPHIDSITPEDTLVPVTCDAGGTVIPVVASTQSGLVGIVPVVSPGADGYVMAGLHPLNGRPVVDRIHVWDTVSMRVRRPQDPWTGDVIAADGIFSLAT